MSNLDALLARLDGVQKSGPGCRARCPACGGKSRKLSVTAFDNGGIGVHCFGGCEALAVVQAIGLTVADLFPEPIAPRTPEERDRARRLAREGQWGAALETLEFEARIVLIAAQSVIDGEPLEFGDFQRVCQAQHRIEEARDVLRGRAAWRRKVVA